MDNNSLNLYTEGLKSRKTINTLIQVLEKNEKEQEEGRRVFLKNLGFCPQVR